MRTNRRGRAGGRVVSSLYFSAFSRLRPRGVFSLFCRTGTSFLPVMAFFGCFGWACQLTLCPARVCTTTVEGGRGCCKWAELGNRGVLIGGSCHVTVTSRCSRVLIGCGLIVAIVEGRIGRCYAVVFPLRQTPFRVSTVCVCAWFVFGPFVVWVATPFAAAWRVRARSARSAAASVGGGGGWGVPNPRGLGAPEGARRRRRWIACC